MQVGDYGAATLAVLVVVDGMAEDFALVCRIRIDWDFGKATTSDKPFLRGRVSRLLVQDAIIGSDIAGRLRRNEFVDRRQDISIFPARWEVGVKIGLRWLKEQTSIDGAGTADGATDESVDLVGATGQTGSAGKDGFEKSWYVDTAQVGAGQPGRSLGASGDAVRWPTSLQEKDFLCCILAKPARSDDSRGTGTDYDHIP